MSTALHSFFFSVPLSFYLLYIPKEKKGKGKASACVLQNDSKWERKYLAQQHQPSNKHCPDGVAKAQGAMSLAVQEEKNRWVHAFLPSLPPHKFKISYKALVSSSKHGVTFIRLLLNSLVATLT